MKKELPNYRVSGVDFIEKKLSKDDKKILNDFLKYCGITAGEHKLKDRRLTLLQIKDVMEKPFDKINLEDVRGFLSVINKSDKRDWTKRGLKQTLKMFLKWYYKDWSARFDNLRDVKLGKVTTQDKINKSTLITPEDIELLLRNANTLRDKAYISLLSEIGCRPQEIQHLKWKDFKLDGELGEVSLFSGKTETARTLPIKRSLVHLNRWKQEFAYPNIKQSDFVFPSPEDRSKPISANNIWYTLRRIAKKSGIEKPVYNYIFRHSVLNDLYKKVPIQIHRKYAGHSKDSHMTATYEHLDNEDMFQIVLDKVYNVKEISEEERNELQKKIEIILDVLSKDKNLSKDTLKTLSNLK